MASLAKIASRNTSQVTIAMRNSNPLTFAMYMTRSTLRLVHTRLHVTRMHTARFQATGVLLPLRRHCHSSAKDLYRVKTDLSGLSQTDCLQVLRKELEVYQALGYGVPEVVSDADLEVVLSLTRSGRLTAYRYLSGTEQFRAQLEAEGDSQRRVAKDESQRCAAEGESRRCAAEDESHASGVKADQSEGYSAEGEAQKRGARGESQIYRAKDESQKEEDEGVVGLNANLSGLKNSSQRIIVDQYSLDITRDNTWFLADEIKRACDHNLHMRGAFFFQVCTRYLHPFLIERIELLQSYDPYRHQIELTDDRFFEEGQGEENGLVYLYRHGKRCLEDFEPDVTYVFGYENPTRFFPSSQLPEIDTARFPTNNYVLPFQLSRKNAALSLDTAVKYLYARREGERWPVIFGKHTPLSWMRAVYWCDGGKASSETARLLRRKESAPENAGENGWQHSGNYKQRLGNFQQHLGRAAEK